MENDKNILRNSQITQLSEHFVSEINNSIETPLKFIIREIAEQIINFKTELKYTNESLIQERNEKETLKKSYEALRAENERLNKIITDCKNEKETLIKNLNGAEMTSERLSKKITDCEIGADHLRREIERLKIETKAFEIIEAMKQQITDLFNLKNGIVQTEIKGYEKILNQILHRCEEHGIHILFSEEGDKFIPEKHERIQTVDTNNLQRDECIKETATVGIFYDKSLGRPPIFEKVIVYKYNAYARSDNANKLEADGLQEQPITYVVSP